MRCMGVWARSSRQQVKAAIWVCAEIFCVRNSKAAAPFNSVNSQDTCCALHSKLKDSLLAIIAGFGLSGTYRHQLVRRCIERSVSTRCRTARLIEVQC